MASDFGTVQCFRAERDLVQSSGSGLMRSSVLGVSGLAVYASRQRPPLHICAAMRRGVVREPGTRGKTACQRHHEPPSSKTHPLHVTPFSRYQEAVSPRLNASPSSSLHHPQWGWSQGGVAQWQSASEFVFLSVNFVFLSDLHSYHSGRRAANGPGFDSQLPQHTHEPGLDGLWSIEFGLFFLVPSAQCKYSSYGAP